MCMYTIMWLPWTQAEILYRGEARPKKVPHGEKGPQKKR